MPPQAEGLCSDSQSQVKITESACAYNPAAGEEGPGAHRSAVQLYRSVTSRFSESLSKKLRLKVTEEIPPVTSGLDTRVHTCTNVCIPHRHRDRSIHVHRRFPSCPRVHASLSRHLLTFLLGIPPSLPTNPSPSVSLLPLTSRTFRFYPAPTHPITPSYTLLFLITVPVSQNLFPSRMPRRVTLHGSHAKGHFLPLWHCTCNLGLLVGTVCDVFLGQRGSLFGLGLGKWVSYAFPLNYT